MRADSVGAARSDNHRTGGGSTPTPALRQVRRFKPRELDIRPISPDVARCVCERGHYLGSYPGASSLLNFGVFAKNMLLGVAVLGAGPPNIHRLFTGADRRQVLSLTRFWLDDRLGRNSESRVLGVVLRQLRRHQSVVRAIVAYSDPTAGHTGTIYRALGFLYLGESQATPLYRLPGGKPRHSRSFSQVFGTRSRKYFADQGIDLERIPQGRKLVYVAILDPCWRDRIRAQVLPYPKGDVTNERD